ncbi:MAG: DUF1905 domain-containing protein [Anaerolineaceae bacterium]|nr:DUF1905 domain-containing protein [Anaerolineaceae bacterium]
MSPIDPGEIAFESVILRAEGRGGGAYVEFPFDVEALFGTRGRVPVRAWFDGIPYQGSLVKMGIDCHIIGVRKDILATIGKTAGDSIQVQLVLDDQPRVVSVPDDLRALLDAEAEAKAFFEQLSYSKQNAFVQWIESAKKNETRQTRLETAINMLRAKQTR